MAAPGRAKAAPGGRWRRSCIEAGNDAPICSCRVRSSYTLSCDPLSIRLRVFAPKPLALPGHQTSDYVGEALGEVSWASQPRPFALIAVEGPAPLYLLD